MSVGLAELKNTNHSSPCDLCVEAVAAVLIPLEPRRELDAASAVSMELDAPRGAEPEAPVQGGGARGPRPGGRSPRPPSRGAEPEAPVQGGGAPGGFNK
ncbi:unnamed protein product [Gadus morhua 'NCC']